MIRFLVGLAVLVVTHPAFAAAPADEAEIKLTIHPLHTDLLLDRLRVRADQAEGRRIYYFDTCAMGLYNRGVILRGREKIGSADDVTAKLRPFDANWADSSWDSVDGFKCEWDVSNATLTSSCSLTQRVRPDELNLAERGFRQFVALFSSDQILYLNTYAHLLSFDRSSPLSSPIPWSDLISIGPIEVYVWRARAQELPHRMTVEHWRLPSGNAITEISIKVRTEEVLTAREDFYRTLVGWGFTPYEDAESKTKAALADALQFEQGCINRFNL